MGFERYGVTDGCGHNVGFWIGMVSVGKDFRDLDGWFGCSDNGMKSMDFGIWQHFRFEGKGDRMESGRI